MYLVTTSTNARSNIKKRVAAIRGALVVPIGLGNICMLTAQ